MDMRIIGVLALVGLTLGWHEEKHHDDRVPTATLDALNSETIIASTDINRPIDQDKEPTRTDGLISNEESNVTFESENINKRWINQDNQYTKGNNDYYIDESTGRGNRHRVENIETENTRWETDSHKGIKHNNNGNEYYNPEGRPNIDNTDYYNNNNHNSQDEEEDEGGSSSYENSSAKYETGECTDRYREGNIEVQYSWNVLHFNIPRKYVGSLPSSRRQYISGLSVTKDRIFLSPGGVFGRVPVTFATVPKNSCTKSPILEPYPNFDWHVEAATKRSISDCNRAFVAVYRSRLDSCNRIWVLDTGRIYYGNTDQQELLCPPKIVVFDLSTDKPVRIITLPRSVYRNGSSFNDLILDEQRHVGGRYRTCDDTMVYVLDTVQSAIIVYDSAKDAFSRASNAYLQPDPNWGIHQVGGERFTAVFGVISQALGRNGRLYLQPFASNKVYSVRTSDLQKSLYVSRDTARESAVNIPVSVEFVKPCTAVGMETFRRDGTVLYGPLCENALYAWDPRTNTSRRVTRRNRDILQVIEDIKPDDADENKVLMLTSREQKYFLNEVNTDEENQRLIIVDLS